MNALNSLIAAVVLVPLGVVAASNVPAAESPQADAGARRDSQSLSLRQIVLQLEKEGFGPFTEVSFDDGAWEVEAYRGEASLELIVDPQTGEVISEHRDDAEPAPRKDALPLSALLEKLEQAGHKAIEEVSFERRYWEVEIRRDRQKHELHVDPRSGKIVSDRIDD